MMLSRLLAAGALAALSFGLTLPLSADPSLNARTAIASAYAHMNKALARRDISTYTAYLHPDYIVIFPSGKEIHGRQKAAAPLHQMFSMARKVTSSTRLLICSLQSGGAIVTTQETITLSSQNAAKPLLIKTVDKVRSFWLKINGHWLLKQERLLSDTTTINGVETKATE